MHQATYAHRFNQRAIQRPTIASLPIVDMTEEQFAVYRDALPTDLERSMANFARACGRAFANFPGNGILR